MECVSIPVMAKVRIGHFAEGQILQSLGVDYIDESEVLTPADEENHVDKFAFETPFVCGARNLGEALRRIGEGAALIRTKGEAGSGNVVEAVRHMRTVTGEISRLTTLRGTISTAQSVVRRAACTYRCVLRCHRLWHQHHVRRCWCGDKHRQWGDAERFGNALGTIVDGGSESYGQWQYGWSFFSWRG